MPRDRSRRLAILRTTWSEVRDDRASIVAAGVAFWVALASLPSIALLVWTASRTIGPDDARALIGTLSDIMPDASRSVIEKTVQAALGNNPADGAAEAAWFGCFALKRDPFSGQAFVFRGRQGRRVKILWWAEGARGSVRRSLMEWRVEGGQGYCLFAKRIEKGRFLWPAAAQGAAAALRPAQIAMLLEGIDWRAPVRTDQPRLAG